MLFVLDRCLELLNFAYTLVNLFNGLLNVNNLLIKDFLLLKGLLVDTFDFICRLLGLLVCLHGAHLGILVVSLQLIVATLQLGDFLQLFGLCRSLRLLLLSELITIKS